MLENKTTLWGKRNVKEKERDRGRVWKSEEVFEKGGVKTGWGGGKIKVDRMMKKKTSSDSEIAEKGKWKGAVQ